MTETEALVALSMIAEPGDRTFRQYVDEFNSPEIALDSLERGEDFGVPEYAELLVRVQPRILRDRFDSVLQRVADSGITVVDPSTVVGIDHLHPFDQPTALFVQGDTALLRSTATTLAVVGARAATGYGERVATDLVTWAGELGVGTVISGAAYGIDGTAHRSALATGLHTVAVLAGGLDRYYPSGHHELIERIAEHGAVVSELPPGFPPTKFRFLQRNRLIAAMSDGLVVAEAGFRSGSLNAAGHAQNQGVPLGAVPGSIYSSTSAGCHRLLREFGAQLIADKPDLATLLGLEPREG